MALDSLRLRSTTSSPSVEPNRHHQLKQEEQRNTYIERDQNQNYLLKIKELPPWADPNPHILTSYRPSSNNTLTSLASIFSHWHNETTNIHTHLVPAVLLILLLTHSTLYTYLVTKYGDRLTPFDWGIIVTQLLTATGCLLASTLYHTLLNHSERVAEVWLAVDYVGIIALMMGDFVSGLHFGFYCFPRVKFFYWGLITVLSILSGIVLLSPRYKSEDHRLFRVGVLVATGLSAFAPIGHAWILWGTAYVMGIGVGWYLLEGGCLMLGCWLWITRFPECLYPGRFDLWGGSHALWHVFVVFSIAAHVAGLLKGVEFSYHGLCAHY
ncbi:hemolysin-III related protein [Aspergillus taichungensis]|uniref:Hemolysin-III related protein n=1 Tax=Aspergillus taichungensis TaxID=482145 RepID=A0A2J5HW78_9EURO|nr:hemolysin-III related protein [Aspergillus taichungensis]